MQSEEAKIRISSNLLREPQVLDNLCPTGGSIARNILIWASWKNTLRVQLNLPDFCARMGYDRRHLLRALTDDQKELMLAAGWPPEMLERRDKEGKLNIENGNSLIAYVLTLMFSRTLPFKHRSKNSRHLHFYNKVMIRELLVFEKRKKGTCIEFLVSEEVIGQARGAFQTIHLRDYLSLVNEKNGKADDAAQRLYMRLLWKRQYWDYLDREGKIEKGTNPSVDYYDELLAVAGLEKYAQASLAAHKLGKLLLRVSKLDSIKMTPNLKLNHATSCYEVSWRREKLPAAAQQDQPTEFPFAVVAPNKGAKPTEPLLTHSAFRGSKGEVATTTARSPAATPKQRVVATAPPKVNREKLLNEHADTSNSVQFLLSEKGQDAYASMPPEKYQQDVAAAKARLQQLTQQLEMR